MIRHISLYTLEEPNEIQVMKEMLIQIGENDPLIQMSVVKENVSGGSAIFAHLAWLLHFDNMDDVHTFVNSKAHLALIQSGPKCEVKVIDYLID